MRFSKRASPVLGRLVLPFVTLLVGYFSQIHTLVMHQIDTLNTLSIKDLSDHACRRNSVFDQRAWFPPIL